MITRKTTPPTRPPWALKDDTIPYTLCGDVLHSHRPWLKTPLGFCEDPS